MSAPAGANTAEVRHCTAEQYLELLESLYAEGYSVCADLCAVDYLTNSHRSLPPEVTPERFEVVANLLDMSQHRRVRVRAQVPTGTADPADPANPTSANPAIASITHIFAGAEAMEREAADLFGITFTGHPDPTRILMPEDWDGHPLRKDYEVGEIPVQFKAVPGR